MRILGVALLLVVAGIVSGAEVAEMRAPDGGMAPQAMVDDRGVLHVIYFKGAAEAGDVFYAQSKDSGATFSHALRVNSREQSAEVIGTVRGPQMALGRRGRVHVAWMGGGAEREAPIWYARLNDAGDAFEAQRNESGTHPGLDGGGSVAADGAGRVFVVWHAPASRRDASEAGRRVWIARSDDDGASFAAETDGAAEPLGVCACCNLRAFATNGLLHVLYRCATGQVHRDMHLLTFDERVNCIADRTVGTITINKCVMSTAAFAADDAVTLAAWESEQNIFLQRVAPDGSVTEPIAAPGEGKARKHPAIAVNRKGETILAWTENTAWNRGGSVAWQVFDSQAKPVGAVGHAEGLPVWGTVSAFVRGDGSFVIMY